MPARFGRHRPPPWWPDGEPWPPRHQRQRRFAWRLAIGALFLIGMSAAGTVTLASLTAVIVGWMPPFSGRGGALLVVAGAVSLVLILFGLMFAVRRVALPLGSVMDAADRVAAGDYEVRVAERGSPPVRGLARAFNAMVSRLQDHNRLRRDLMADIAHELRTPLTIVQGRLEGLLDGVYARDDQQLKQLLEETHVLARLIEDLRTLALSAGGVLKLEREPTDLSSLARDVADGFAPAADGGGVAIAVDAPDAFPSIDVDPVRMREVLVNLIANAVRHTPVGGHVTVRIRQTASGVQVEIKDDGTGMSAAELARAFDRFYKGTGSRGSGLGLAIARSLVAAHGGAIEASSTPGEGTVVTFTLPHAT